MTDVLRMTPLELLRWLGTFDDRGQVRATPSMALACVNVGITDTDRIAAIDGPLSMEVGALGRLGPLHPPLNVIEVGILAAVGHRVIMEDRDNAADWALFAEHLEKTADQWKGGKGYVGHEYARTVIASLLDAGRGPRYARDVLDRAAAAGLLPNTYGWTVDPQEFSDLAAAGVRSATQIAEWQRALGDRYMPGRMLELAAAGVASSVAVAAAEQGIPDVDWPDRIGGIPAGWVRASGEGHRYDRPDLSNDPIVPAVLPRSTTRANTLGAPWSLDDLHFLAHHGWADVDLYNLTSVRYGKGRRGGSVTLEASDARYLAEHGLTPEAVGRIKTALSEGTYSTDDGTPPYLDGSAKLPDIVVLHEAGFRASHALTWRWAGCRSAADVLRAIEAGITPTAADELTRRHGGKLGRWGKRPGLRSVDELLRLHSGDHDPVD